MQWVVELFGYSPRGSLGDAVERFADKRAAWTAESPDARLVWRIAADVTESLSQRELVLDVALTFVTTLATRHGMTHQRSAGAVLDGLRAGNTDLVALEEEAQNGAAFWDDFDWDSLWGEDLDQYRRAEGAESALRALLRAFRYSRKVSDGDPQAKARFCNAVMQVADIWCDVVTGLHEDEPDYEEVCRRVHDEVAEAMRARCEFAIELF